MPIPNDPVMLLSYINTQLRDFYESLEDFCASNSHNIEDITKKLATIDYVYDNQLNQFV